MELDIEGFLLGEASVEENQEGAMEGWRVPGVGEEIEFFMELSQGAEPGWVPNPKWRRPGKNLE